MVKFDDIGSPALNIVRCLSSLQSGIISTTKIRACVVRCDHDPTSILDHGTMFKIFTKNQMQFPYIKKYAWNDLTDILQGWVMSSIIPMHLLDCRKWRPSKVQINDISFRISQQISQQTPKILLENAMIKNQV